MSVSLSIIPGFHRFSLDEFPLFRSDVIEALRQPLESGEVTVARRDESVTLPARGMVVLACNPCPCGEYTPKPQTNQCRCGERQRRDYRQKITGPVADRVDILRHVVTEERKRQDRFARRDSSAEIRTRVEAARRAQAQRYAGCSWRLNAHAPAPVLRERWPLAPEAQEHIDTATWRGELTQRGAARVLRLAWTVADLAGLDRPGLAEATTALALRTGAPLMVEALSRRVG